MDLLDALEQLGVDIDSALSRFMGNQDLLEMMYKKIPDSFEQNKDVIPLIETGKIDAAIQQAHTLKGNTGNLSITPLYTAYTEIVNDLRAGQAATALEKAKAIQPTQEKVLQTIRSFI